MPLAPEKIKWHNLHEKPLKLSGLRKAMEDPKELKKTLDQVLPTANMSMTVLGRNMKGQTKIEHVGLRPFISLGPRTTLMPICGVSISRVTKPGEGGKPGRIKMEPELKIPETMGGGKMFIVQRQPHWFAKAFGAKERRVFVDSRGKPLQLKPEIYEMISPHLTAKELHGYVSGGKPEFVNIVSKDKLVDERSQREIFLTHPSTFLAKEFMAAASDHVRTLEAHNKSGISSVPLPVWALMKGVNMIPAIQDDGQLLFTIQEPKTGRVTFVDHTGKIFNPPTPPENPRG